MDYIPLEYDRSHLQVRKSQQQQGVTIDYLDIILITINLLACVAIFVYYIITPRKINEEISVKTTEKIVEDIPNVNYTRHGKKTKPKDQKEARDYNPHTHHPGYNQVQVRCTKCTHTSFIYEQRVHENA